jgi:peptidoglycan/xylan/chitin deacetylase (PgdA/CDA1 family)
MTKEQLSAFQRQLETLRTRYSALLKAAQGDPTYFATIQAQLTHLRNLLEQCQAHYQKVATTNSAPDAYGQVGNYQPVEPNPCKNCDSFQFLVDYPELKTLYSIYKKYKNHPAFNIDYNGFKQLNRHLEVKNGRSDFAGMSKGDWVCLPKGVLGTTSNTQYDELRFLVDTDDVNIYQVHERFAKHPRYGISYAQLQALNSHLQLDNMHRGDIIYLPKGTLSTNPNPNPSVVVPAPNTGTSNTETAGDPNGNKTVLVSWTFDDGPVPATDQLEAKLGIDNATWFIVRANMNRNEGWDANASRYRRYQEEGGTIGIHAQHTSIDHIIWFPDKTHPLYQSYDSMKAAMNDLEFFYGQLTNSNIYPKFVRPPGGLASQLQGYARHLGFKGDAQRQARNAILENKGFNAISDAAPTDRGLDGKTLQEHFATMQRDYNTLKSRLKKLKLFLWSGTEDPDKIAPQSWNAASAGTAGMVDDVTNVVSVKAQRQKKNPNYYRYVGKFEKLVQGMRPGEEKPFIILAHDTQPHLEEIFRDKKQMEDYARANGTKIVYVNINELFTRTTHKNVNTYTPDY